jgi:poly(A) polymerase
LLKTEKHYGLAPDILVRLAALLPENETMAHEVAKRLKLPNRGRETLCALATLPKQIREHCAPQALRRIIYIHRTTNCRRAASLVDGDLAGLLKIIDEWTPPTFPIKGADIVRLGTPAGPHVGEILKAVEKWWIDGDFQGDRTACLLRAKELGGG